MIKRNKWKLLISSIAILLPIVFGLIVWNKLPDQIVNHWGVDGNPNGWSNRSFAVFGLPTFILCVHWFCVFCTARDPKNKNQSNKIFSIVFWICPIISLIVNGMIYATALGQPLKPYFAVYLLMGLLFVIIGNYLPKCKQNHTIGIRVKWTLENEENWNATHRFCGKVWTVGGVLIMACLLLPESISPYVVMALIIVLSILPIGYSYCYFKKGFTEI